MHDMLVDALPSDRSIHPITPLDHTVAPDYTSPKVKAFSVRLPGWGYMAAGHNDPARRSLEEQEVDAAHRGLAPVEYVRYLNNAILDVSGTGKVYGQVGAARYYPFYQLGLVFSDSQGNNAGVPNNGLVYNLAGEGVRTVGIVSGVNGPDWPQYKKFAFRSVQHFNESNDLIITFAYKTKVRACLACVHTHALLASLWHSTTHLCFDQSPLHTHKGWNPYFSIVPPTPAPTPAPTV